MTTNKKPDCLLIGIKLNSSKSSFVKSSANLGLILDLILTFSAIERARRKEDGIPPSNSYEVFLDKTFNQKYLHNMFNNNWGERK